MDDTCTEPGSINPAKEFYLVLCASPDDGSARVNWDGNIGYPREELAVSATRESVDEAGGEYMVYRCVPVKRIYRGRTTVVPYKPR